MDGFSAAQIFSSVNSYAYNDLIILPGFVKDPVSAISLKTHLSKNIVLNIPIVSSPMDTVTGDKMAIGMALCGGIGIIHRNNTIEEQIDLVKKVKRYRNGFITDPVRLTPDNLVSDVIAIKKEKGFSGIPIVQDKKLVGIVSARDIEFKDPNLKLSDVMTTDLVVANESCTLQEAIQILCDSKKGRLPIVDKDYNLISLVSRKDIKKNSEYPLASMDNQKRLLVGAAIGTQEYDKERARRLIEEAEVDVICIDSSQGNSVFQIEMIKYLKSIFNVDVIAGNIVTSDQAQNLIKAGADALRVGCGIGASCITQEVCATGRSQCSAIYHVAKNSKVPVIADGGITGSGDIIKALTLGASTCMLGSMLAGTDESAAESMYENGIKLKKYRGMGSIEAMNKFSDRYNSENVKVAQGVSGYVTHRGDLNKYLTYILEAVKHGFQNIGIGNMDEIKKIPIRYEIRTTGGQKEGSVHSLYRYEKN